MLPFLELPAVKSEMVTVMNEGGAGYQASPVGTDKRILISGQKVKARLGRPAVTQ